MKRFAIRIWLGYLRARGFAILSRILAPIAFSLMCLFSVGIIESLGTLFGTTNFGVGLLGWMGLTIAVFFAALALPMSLRDSLHEFLERIPGAPRLAGRGHISVGTDGVLIEVGKQIRFISYRDVGDVYLVKGGRVMVRHQDGTSTGLALRASEADQFVEAVTEARAAFLEASRVPLPALPSALRVGGADAYRGGPSLEEVARVALSPAAEPAARAAAVRALVDSPEPLRAKLRVAAEGTADPEVQQAFVEVGDALEEQA